MVYVFINGIKELNIKKVKQKWEPDVGSLLYTN